MLPSLGILAGIMTLAYYIGGREAETFESPVSCNICGKTFDSFRGLNGHMNAHIPAHRKRAETISSIIHGYFIHTPDE